MASSSTPSSSSGNDDDMISLSNNTNANDQQQNQNEHIIIQKKKYEETEDETKLRFEMELEFIQLLSNPSYLQYLAQYKYFEDPAFIEYLKYLQYWKRPEYAKFIRFPNCLFMLDRIVTDAQFREECKLNPFRDLLQQQIMCHWSFYRKNREEALKKKSFEFDEPTNPAEANTTMNG
ncbi:hypothetical protein C9374_002768 [Naegleria lovaniensis]|uniref:Mediator of RNA polymerase II transcription subunit 31 n=1 Tax=Naegleria lovaniensis TaxID=51637 RepID=A0AA88KQD0_NAELO|nr:uncharacterized protein C9374_002768 [Naegleria lovaniensis]KAG2386322.1 hypothetical protein C9374_002768 [Naegleria lovaniensis]